MRVNARVIPLKSAILARFLIPFLRPVSTETDATAVIDHIIHNLVLSVSGSILELIRLSALPIAPAPRPSEVQTPNVVHAMVIESIMSPTKPFTALPISGWNA